jgi:hypothetical protein
VFLEETDEFLANNVNKNTSYKTKSDMKIFTDWLMANNEFRDVKDIPPIELVACQVLHRYVKNIIFDIYPTLFPRTPLLTYTLICKIQPISKHPILTNTLICKIQPINAI